jgi:hypothetical protein
MIKIANKIENVAQLKYLEMTVAFRCLRITETHTKLIQEEIKREIEFS